MIPMIRQEAVGTATLSSSHSDALLRLILLKIKPFCFVTALINVSQIPEVGSGE